MNLPKQVEIIDVCPRDGFQNVVDLIPIEGKIKVINKLAEAGFKRIEICSFVSPKAIPQMANSVEVVSRVKDNLKKHGVKMAALVPNARGVETAVECGVDEVTFVVSVSEKHNMANVKCMPEESMAKLKELINQYGSKIKFRLALATALGCPFGVDITVDKVRKMVSQGIEFGCDEVMIADTVGIATPLFTYNMMEALVKEFGKERFIMHLHDTRGMALANTLTAMQLGVHKFETATGGLGGCPFAPGAAGNCATEDLLNMLDKMNIETGIKMDVVKEAVELIKENVNAPIISHISQIKPSNICI